MQKQTEEQIITTMITEFVEDPGGLDPVDVVVECLYLLHQIPCHKYDSILFRFGNIWCNENLDEPHWTLSQLIKALQDKLKE